MRRSFYLISIIVIGLMLLVTASYAQNKHDYYWPFGQDQSLELGIQAIEFNFNNKPFEPEARNGGLQFDQNNASICDKDGNLLFYTNGCAVANRLHEIMPNGDSINAGSFFDDFWFATCDRGYPGTQDITILPDPGNKNGYYIIHKPISYNPDDPSLRPFTKDSLKYTYVDMALNNGFGDVVEKNVNFYVGSLLHSYLTSIIKKNGNDYWIINPELPSGFNVYSLTADSLSFHELETGPKWDTIYSNSTGHAKFSPDGTHYAYFNQYDGLYLYDFDRENGSLSNEQHLPWKPSDRSFFATCEWSPNSRFLYLAQVDTIMQLDTWAEPLDSGLEVIAGFEFGQLGGAYGVAALAPDCKIYLRSLSSNLFFHVIHKPDEKGIACDFVNGGIGLPFHSASGSFPNFPRFRVDEEEKCDPSISTFAGEEIFWRRDLSVYPIPAIDYITVVVPDQLVGDVFILDMQGQFIRHISDVRDDLELDVSGLVAGMYSVEFVPRDNKERLVYTRQVVVGE